MGSIANPGLDHNTALLNDGFCRGITLAHRWNHLIEEGIVTDRAEIARTMTLSRARVTQIMDLLCLAPEIQEEVLDGMLLRSVPERAVRPIIRIPEWTKQSLAWRKSEK